MKGDRTLPISGPLATAQTALIAPSSAVKGARTLPPISEPLATVQTALIAPSSAVKGAR